MLGNCHDCNHTSDDVMDFWEKHAKKGHKVSFEKDK